MEEIVLGKLDEVDSLPTGKIVLDKDLDFASIGLLLLSFFSYLDSDLYLLLLLACYLLLYL